MNRFFQDIRTNVVWFVVGIVEGDHTTSKKNNPVFWDVITYAMPMAMEEKRSRFNLDSILQVGVLVRLNVFTQRVLAIFARSHLLVSSIQY